MVVAALPIAAAAVCAVLAPQLAPYPRRRATSRRAFARPPGWPAAAPPHLLGTDQLGRDILSRLIYGARMSLLVGVVSSLIGGTLGLALGLLERLSSGPHATRWWRSSSTSSSRFRSCSSRSRSIAVLGPSLRNLLVILALSGWVTYARVVRGQALSLREIGLRPVGPEPRLLRRGGSSGATSSRTWSRTRWSS